MSTPTITDPATDPAGVRLVQIMRLVNIVALLALLGVLAGSLFLQFGIGEQPCPLCLVQRSGIVGLALGPIMNLLWGLKPSHYAISILAALVGAAGSSRQILIHIADPNDPGYGPAVLGWHLYTWALVTFVIAIAGISVLMLFPKQFAMGDEGIIKTAGGLRPWIISVAFGVILWMMVDATIIGVSEVFECGLGGCPDDPPDILGVGTIWGAIYLAAIGAVSIAIGFAIERGLRRRAHAEVQ